MFDEENLISLAIFLSFCHSTYVQPNPARSFVFYSHNFRVFSHISLFLSRNFRISGKKKNFSRRCEIFAKRFFFFFPSFVRPRILTQIQQAMSPPITRKSLLNGPYFLHKETGNLVKFFAKEIEVKFLKKRRINCSRCFREILQPLDHCACSVPISYLKLLSTRRVVLHHGNNVQLIEPTQDGSKFRHKKNLPRKFISYRVYPGKHGNLQRSSLFFDDKVCILYLSPNYRKHSFPSTLQCT